MRDTADTSSAAAGTGVTVGTAATTWAMQRSDPMVAKSVAAAVIISGAAIELDISVVLPRHRAPAGKKCRANLPDPPGDFRPLTHDS